MSFPVFVIVSLGIVVTTIAGTARLSRPSWLPVAIAFAGGTALLLFNGLANLKVLLDDAFITFRYSSNLADGLGPTWNSEGHVEGYTNFLWMALLAGLAKVGFDIVVAAQTLGFVFAGVAAFATYRIWKLWADEDGSDSIANPVIFAIVLLGLALNSSVAFWPASGMETPLFMALLTSGAYLHLRERRTQGPPWSAIVFAALAMTRPEGLIVVAITGLFKLLALKDSNDRSRALGSLLLWSAIFLSLYGSYFLWRYTYYDYLLPNTFYAKVGATLATSERGLRYVYENGLQYQILPALFGTAGLLAQPRLRGDAIYILVIVGAMLTGVVIEGGDFMAHGRFVGPLMPLLYVSGITGFAILLKRWVPHPGLAVLVAFVALSLSGMELLQSSNDGTRVSLHRYDRWQAEQFGRWLDAYAPSDFTIAGVAVGVLGYYSNRDVLDVVGINDVVIAHTRVAGLGEGKPGHEKYNTDYVFGQQPEIIPFGAWTRIPLRDEIEPPILGIEGWDAIFRDRRLDENYEPRWLFLANSWYSFFQREDTLAQLQAPGLVGDQNRLGTVVGYSAGEWSGWRGTVLPSEGGILVSSDQIAYSAWLNVPRIQPEQGQTYVALAWVKGSADGVEGQIEILVREDGLREGESRSTVPLSNDWQPIWVPHTVSGSNVNALSVHIVRRGEEATQDAFMFKDPHLMITE